MATQIQNNNCSLNPCITSTVEFITPEKAKEYLLSQQSNRNINDSRVSDYANRMKNGEWEVSQPIIFDEKNRLIDGQHRLAAVIKVNKGVVFLVVRGMPEDSRLTFDLGQKRTVAQIGKMMGMNDSQILNRQSIITAAFTLSYGLKPKNQEAEKSACRTFSIRGKTFSPQTILPYLERYRDGLDFALKEYGNSAPKLAAVKAVIFRAYYNENHARLRDFQKVFCQGVSGNISNADAALALRVYLGKLKASRTGISHNRIAQKDIYQKTESALYHFLKFKNISIIKGFDIEQFPLSEFDRYDGVE